MSGMGNTAKRATCHEIRRKTAPTTMTVVLTCTQQIVGPFVQKSLKLVDVVVENGKNVPFLPFVEPRHPLLLDVVKRVQPQFVLHGLGEVTPENTVEVFEQRLKSPYEEREDGQGNQLMQGSTSPTVANVDSSRSTTTSTARPMSSGGAKSQNLLKIEQKAARRTVPRCGRM